MKFLINDLEYDFDGRVGVTFNGKNKSTLKMAGIYELADETSRKILSFPLYSKVELLDNQNNRLFRGVIKESIPTDITNRYMIKPAKVQVYDYKEFLADGILISKTFRDVEPVEILNWVLENLSEAKPIKFTLDPDVSFGLEMRIASWSIQDGTPYDILNELANRTNSRFWVQDTVIYFKSWAQMITKPKQSLTTVIKDDEIIFDLPELIKVEYQDASSFGYANSIIIRSGNVLSGAPFIENFPVRDGQTVFATNFGIGEIKEAWLFDSRFENWRQLFVRESRWTTQPYNQWFEIKYDQGAKFVEYNSKLPALLNGQTLYLEYFTLNRGVSIQNNTQEITRVANMSNYGNGQITYIEEKNDITSQRDLDNYALSILNKMSTPRQDYIITTGADLKWQPSDIIKIDQDFYVVDSVNWDHLFVKDGVNVLTFEYVLTNTQNDNQQINFYDNRLLANLDAENVLREQVVTADLDLTIEKWTETTQSFPRVLNSAGTNVDIKLLNKDGDVFYQEQKTLTDGKQYVLEVNLDGK